MVMTQMDAIKILTASIWCEVGSAYASDRRCQVKKIKPSGMETFQSGHVSFSVCLGLGYVKPLETNVRSHRLA